MKKTIILSLIFCLLLANSKIMNAQSTACGGTATSANCYALNSPTGSGIGSDDTYSICTGLSLSVEVHRWGSTGHANFEIDCGSTYTLELPVFDAPGDDDWRFSVDASYNDTGYLYLMAAADNGSNSEINVSW
jgi:hypothetical protein